MATNSVGTSHSEPTTETYGLVTRLVYPPNDEYWGTGSDGATSWTIRTLHLDGWVGEEHCRALDDAYEMGRRSMQPQVDLYRKALASAMNERQMLLAEIGKAHSIVDGMCEVKHG